MRINLFFFFFHVQILLKDGIMVGIYSFKLSLSMMKVLMKKILFKKKNLHRLYKIHNTFYNTVVLQNIISCQGEQVKKKKR